MDLIFFKFHHSKNFLQLFIKFVSIILLLLLSSTCTIINATTNPDSEPGVPTDETFFNLVLNDIGGKPINFDQFKGKTTLLVNTASQCSHTESHFRSLKRMYDILGFNGAFNIIAAPCNDFGEQEPWDETEVEEYYRRHVGIEFIILAKSPMSSSDLWKWVKGTSVAPSWNFHKYLINGQGIIVRNWSAETSIESIFEDVQAVVNNLGGCDKDKKNSRVITKEEQLEKNNSKNKDIDDNVKIEL